MVPEVDQLNGADPMGGYQSHPDQREKGSGFRIWISQGIDKI